MHTDNFDFWGEARKIRQCYRRAMAIFTGNADEEAQSQFLRDLVTVDHQWFDDLDQRVDTQDWAGFVQRLNVAVERLTFAMNVVTTDQWKLGTPDNFLELNQRMLDSLSQFAAFERTIWSAIEQQHSSGNQDWKTTQLAFYMLSHDLRAFQESAS